MSDQQKLETNILTMVVMNVDMVIIGSRGRGSVKGALLGSVSKYVLDKSKVPVLIVK